ncbi:MAG: DUF1684 domain-containing protein [Rhodospirillales bacterium]|nr:MAG: DUF1684 domain-containing protein [Rhodospirillales bacterium]
MREPMPQPRQPAAPRSNPALQIADWRRQVAALYARIRSAADPAVGWEDWRRTRNALFAHHPQSPLPAADRAVFAGLPCYPYDPSLRFAVELAPIADETEQRMELGADGAVRLLPAGRTVGLEGPLGGELTVFWIAGYGGGLFLPFTDATSGRETFGGGRYLLDSIKGADLGMAEGRLVLDFNFAYHPFCVHSSDWTCPLAPAGNNLRQPVRGGERLA